MHLDAANVNAVKLKLKAVPVIVQKIFRCDDNEVINFDKYNVITVGCKYQQCVQIRMLNCHLKMLVLRLLCLLRIKKVLCCADRCNCRTLCQDCKFSRDHWGQWGAFFFQQIGYRQNKCRLNILRPPRVLNCAKCSRQAMSLPGISDRRHVLDATAARSQVVDGESPDSRFKFYGGRPDSVCGFQGELWMRFSNLVYLFLF